MSHTSKMRVALNNTDALAKAIEAMGGTVIGPGTCKLFSSQETGFVFHLSNWRYPLCLTADGQLKYDDYRGSWGNIKDIEKLKGAYIVAVAKQVAESQGIYSEMVGENLMIQYPTGTVIVAPNGVIDVNGVVGSSCEEITSALENALGTVESRECKVDFYSETAKIHLIE